MTFYKIFWIILRQPRFGILLANLVIPIQLIASYLSPKIVRVKDYQGREVTKSLLFDRFNEWDGYLSPLPVPGH